MHDGYDTNDEIENESYDIIEMDENAYNLLSSNEMTLLDEVVSSVINLAKEDPVDKAHISQFWRYLSDRLYKSRYEFVQNRLELENQKTDLEHKLLTLDHTSIEYMTTLRKIGDVVAARRVVKDMGEYIQVACKNINTIGNFVVGMSERQYTPRSKKYSEKEQVKEQPKTTVKVSGFHPNNIMKAAGKQKRQ